MKIDSKAVLKRDKNKLVKIGPSESMSKSKNVIDPEFIINNYGADSVGCLFYQTVLPRKMFNGLIKEWYHRINLFKNFGRCIKS